MVPEVRYTVRAVRWQPLLLSLAGGTVLLAAASIVEGSWAASALAFAVMVIAAAMAFCLDDPAAETIACVPVPLVVRVLRAIAVGAVLAGLGWVLMALLAAGLAPAGELTVVIVGLTGIGCSIAAAVRRRVGPVAGGTAAAPLVVVCGLAATTVPDPWSLTPGHVGMAWRWGVLLAVSAAVFAWSVRDPARGRARRPARTVV